MAATLVAAVGATPATASLHLSATPRLVPPFRAGASDYVSRCNAETKLALTVRATNGARVSVGGRPERRGTFTTHLARRAGEGVWARARSASGAIRRYHVRCLPRDFPRWSVKRRGAPQAQWYVTAPVKPPRGGYVAIFDSNGAPVWWRRSPSHRSMPWDAKLLDDGRLAWSLSFGDPFGIRPEGGFEERTLDARRIRRLRTTGSPTDAHDFERLPDGNFLAITYRPRDDVDLSRYGGARHARVFDGVIQELTPAGKVVWRWSSRDHFSPSETGREWWYSEKFGETSPRTRGYDLVHVNSIEPDGDGLIVSARHLNAVFRIDRATGDVEWKLGGSFVPGESLAVFGVPVGEQVFGGQHDARVLDDGTVTVYDNRGRTDGAPAAVRFRIDPIARTATRIGHATNPEVPKSKWGGSARKLPGGNWVICWGGTNLITEQTPGGAVVLALRLAQRRVSYRAQPLSPGRLSAHTLRRGMDRMAARRQG